MCAREDPPELTAPPVRLGEADARIMTGPTSHPAPSPHARGNGGHTGAPSTGGAPHGPGAGPYAPDATESPHGSKAKAKLSGDLADFLIELSSAIQKYAMYPPGHPALEPTALGVARRLASLLHDRITLNLGVARDQLVIEGVATDSHHPLLRSLAERLHRHQIGALSFNRGVETEELGEVLALIATEPERTGHPLGLEADEVLRGRPHVHLHALRFERLELQEDGGERTERSGHASHLWIGLAQAAMAAESSDDAGSADPGTVARAIDRRSGEEAYDQVIVGYMLQIAEELKTTSGDEAQELRDRMSSLIAQLQPGTLSRLLHMGGNATQRRQFLLDSSEGMGVDAVLELVEAASQSWNTGISGSMLRLLSKMARHAEVEGQPAHKEADAALRDQVHRLVSGWKLENPNPEAYEEALERMSAGAPMVTMQTRPAHAPEPDRIVKMSLEVSAVGDPVWRSVEEMVRRGEVSSLIEILDDAPPSNGVEGEIWEHLASRETVRSVVETEPPDFAALDRLLPRMEIDVAGDLLDALVTSSSRSTRRNLFDRLAAMGSALAPLLVERMKDPRWYVLRNMLALLGELPEWPEGFSPRPYTTHENQLVRWEALKLSMRVAADRDAAVVAALTDKSDRSVALGLAEAEKACPPDAEPHLVAVATDRGARPEFRQAAVRALVSLGSEGALETLLRLTRGKRRWFRRSELPEASPWVVAAIGGLAQRWPQDPRAAAVLSRAMQSEDPELRRAASP
ncbi:MAG: HEAT repeat domain-containing protein [Gemmatimonadota bacterium]